MSEQIFTIDLPVRCLGPEQDALGYHQASRIIGAELEPCADLLGVEFWTVEFSAEEEIISGLPRLIGLGDDGEPGPVPGRRAPPGLVDYLPGGTRSEFIPLMGPRDMQPSARSSLVGRGWTLEYPFLKSIGSALVYRSLEEDPAIEDWLHHSLDDRIVAVLPTDGTAHSNLAAMAALRRDLPAIARYFTRELMLGDHLPRARAAFAPRLIQS